MNIDKLNKIIKEANNIVFFGGAGVSTESGIPDFRSQDGLYNKKYDYPPEEILSHDFFLNHNEIFYKFYFDKMIYLDAKPNITHIKLKMLEDKGKLKAIITQNIDGLHEMAGSKNIINLHGTIYKNYCINCHKFYSLEYMLKNKKNLKCECGGLIKPNVVLYNEPLDNSIVNKAIDYISKADTLIIGGTSLTVYPAASFINYFKGKNLILINKDKINNFFADITINKSLGDVFSKIDV